jgi:hypothetical protein
MADTFKDIATSLKRIADAMEPKRSKPLLFGIPVEEYPADALWAHASGDNGPALAFMRARDEAAYHG